MKSKWFLMAAGAVLVAGLALVVAPQTALAACSTGHCVRDDFTSQVFTGSSGDRAWGSAWSESGDDNSASLAAGDILIQTSASPNYLEFNAGAASGDNWSRCVGMFPSNAQADKLVLKSQIWADVSTENDSCGDHIWIEYALSANPTTTCGTSAPTTGWNQLVENNADQGQWTDIGGTLPNSLRGNYFWIRIRMACLLDSGTGFSDFQRFNFVEVSYQSALAVTLDSFQAVADPAGSEIDVTWQTAQETDNQGFNLWRGTARDDPNVIKLNANIIPSQAPGGGMGAGYTYPDSYQLVAGTTYFYWLEDVSLGGATTRHEPVTVTYAGPTAVSLARFGATSGVPAALPLAWPLAGAGLVLVALAGLRLRRRRNMTTNQPD